LKCGIVNKPALAQALKELDKDAACPDIVSRLLQGINVMLKPENRSAIIVRFKERGVSPKVFQGASPAISEDHVILLDSEGELIAFYLFELVDTLIQVKVAKMA
jgi:hypothetical protein